MLPAHHEAVELIFTKRAADVDIVDIGEITVETVGNVYLQAAIPLSSLDADDFPKWCSDVLSMMLSEDTNNDVCELMTHQRAELSTNLLLVTVTILDTLT